MNLGSFVDGLFAGAKSTAELMDAKNKLEIQYRRFKDADDAKALADKTTREDAQAKANMAVAQVWNPEGTDTINPGSGSSTPPVPTEIKEGVTGITGVRDPNGIPREHKGALELVDKIAPLVSKSESSDRPYIGYTPENATPEQKARAADLSKNPAMPGYFGFPQWEGNPGPAGNSRAAGLFQFQPDTWKQYAGPLGITDFSPESQRKVFNAAYLAEGIRPWASNRALIGDLAGQRLLGGAATMGARTSAPAAVPSALAGTPAPKTPGGTARPDMEGQPAKTSAPTPAANFASEVLKSVVSGGTTPAQQANVPEGYMTTQPPISVPPPATASPAPIRSSALDPVATSAASSAMSPASSSGSGSGSGSGSAATTVTMPAATRPVLAQLRQSDQGGGMRPPSAMGPSRSGGGQQFAEASGPNKVIRLPNGALVDGIGNIVRPPPSALYPTGTA